MRSLIPKDEAELELQVQASLSWHLCPTLSLWKVPWAVTKFQLLGSTGLLSVPSLGPGPERCETTSAKCLNAHTGEQQVEK